MFSRLLRLFPELPCHDRSPAAARRSGETWLLVFWYLDSGSWLLVACHLIFGIFIFVFFNLSFFFFHFFSLFVVSLGVPWSKGRR